jgi:hypothetical protein
MSWILAGASLAGVAILTLIARLRSRSRRPDVGSVSDEWIAQHRADHHFPTH